MLNIGAPEVLVIVLVALIVLGPARLPEAARQAGRAVQQAKSWASMAEREMKSAMQPDPTPPRSQAEPAAEAAPATAAPATNGSKPHATT